MSPLPTDANANIARHLSLMATRQPERTALKVPRGRTSHGDIDYLTLSFGELEREVGAWSARITTAGVRPGDRTLVMVRQGLPLIASAFALFQVGAVPVIVDPGMGLKSFLACVQRSRPRALVGIPLAQFVSRLARRAFATVKVRVSAPNSLTARLTSAGAHASSLSTESSMSGPLLAHSAAKDLAAILFTSGSTGAPKGVCYEHGMFDAQVRIIRDSYGIEPGEIDLPMLPIFALFNPALGMTTIVPEIDPRRPAAVDPRRIVQAILQENVTNSFGSPTLWRKIGDHCIENRIVLPSLRRVLCAGAPVPDALWESASAWMPAGELHSPYGATEALPVSTISASEIRSLARPAVGESSPTGDDSAKLARRSSAGACVGRPVAGAVVKIIAISDSPIATLSDARELPPGEIGEIIVSSPTVTQRYDDAPEATALARIQNRSAGGENAAPSADLQVTLGTSEFASETTTISDAAWHRLGDCGYLDPEGRLWFCGRKVERVETPQGTLFTEPVERVFRAHPRVTRCALIGFGERGRQRPAIVVEAQLENSGACRALARELRALALAEAATASINLFYFHPKFPVDVRHNAKIHRLALARWAARAKGFETDPKR